MDKRLTNILCCPVSHTPLRTMKKDELAYLNHAIEADNVQLVSGETYKDTIKDGLITTDRKVIYRMDDGIPVLLPEEGIGTTQFTDFP